MADKTRAERNPDGYAYRYHSQLGGTVLRFNHGEDVNGGRPFEVVPYWFSPPDPPRGDGWEALRTVRDSLVAVRQRAIHYQWDDQVVDTIELVDRLLAAAPKEPEPAESSAEPAQDDEAAIEAWGRSMLVHTVGELESDSTPYFASLVCRRAKKGLEIMRSLASENADLLAKLADYEAHQSYRPLIPGNLIDMIDEHGREWTRTDRVRSTVAELVQPQTVEDITRLREKLAAAEERIAEMRGIAKG